MKRKRGLEEEENDSLGPPESESEILSELRTIPLGNLLSLSEKVGTGKGKVILDGGLVDTDRPGHDNCRKKSPRLEMTGSDGKSDKKGQHRPREISSKKRVSPFRDAQPVSKRMRRDPRFDDLSGSFDQDSFDSHYSFLDSVRQDELQELKKSLQSARTRDAIERTEHAIAKGRIVQEKRRKVEQEQWKKEKKEEVGKIMLGKQPYFVKKSERKEQQLRDRFDVLKKNPRKMEATIEKRRQRAAAKDKRSVPWNVRSRAHGEPE